MQPRGVASVVVEGRKLLGWNDYDLAIPPRHGGNTEGLMNRELAPDSSVRGREYSLNGRQAIARQYWPSAGVFADFIGFHRLSNYPGPPSARMLDAREE